MQKRSRILYPRRPPCTPFENLSKSLISQHFERNTNKNQSVDHLADLVFRESKSLVHPYSIIQPLRTRAPSRSCSFKVVLPRVIISTVKILPTHTYTKVSVLSCLGPTGQQKRKTFSVCSAYSWEFSPLLNH